MRKQQRNLGWLTRAVRATQKRRRDGFTTGPATFPRLWLLILDDLPDLSEEDDWWWPASHTGTGWVLATTRHRGPKVTAGGRTLVGVDVFEPRESMAFLRERLSGEDSDGASRLVDAAAEELAAALAICRWAFLTPPPTCLLRICPVRSI